jgi:glycosyltransferase involved in cell wall biosynthesis/SAM-dependent methyltransferase
MRIGVDYRFLSDGRRAVNRGIGRYTQQQLREVLKRDPHNEYRLFCLPDADVDLILPAIRSAPNVSVVIIDVSDSRRSPGPYYAGSENLLRHAEEYQAWLHAQQLDVFHATTPFIWNDVPMPQFDVCPLVATFYDAIPLVFASRYLPPGQRVTELYSYALLFTRQADRLIAISNSARHDANHYLGFPTERIDVAYPVADPAFSVLPAPEVEARMARLRRLLRLTGSFVMAVPHLHYSKNLENLLAGYARLPVALREQLPLVLTGNFLDPELADIRALARAWQIDDYVRITGFVSDDELVALYNAAMIFVHASRYEGFGLPVVEAMKCGVPVITTTASSLPEVGGPAALLVDPEEPGGFAEAIASLFHDPARREAMREAGFCQAARFNSAQLGENTLEAYRSAVVSAPPPARNRPRIAYWSPLPPQRSGIARYSADLLEHLALSNEIEIFVDDGYIPDVTMLSRYVIHHWTAFERRNVQCPFDLSVYQVGASHFHWYMYEILQRYPGLVVLHDLVWSYAIYYAYLGSNQPDPRRQRLNQFIAELLATEGEEAVREFRQMRSLSSGRYHSRLTEFLNRYYMLRRIIDPSRALIVHMEEAARILASRFASTQFRVVLMGTRDPRDNLPATQGRLLKTKLGVRPDVFLIGVFGIVDPVKRVDTVIRALSQLNGLGRDACLVIAGDVHDVQYLRQLRKLARLLRVEDRVIFTGYVDDADLARWLAACEVVVNLRFPSRCQMSAVLTQALASGKPVLMTDLPEWRFLPEAFCWRVPADGTETDTLIQQLNTLASDPGLVQQMSREARDYFEAEATLERMAASYQAIIDELVGGREPAQRSAPSASLGPLAINKVCCLEDFGNPELLELMADLFRHRLSSSSAIAHHPERILFWQTAMLVRALQQQGLLHRAAVVAVLGPGASPLAFYLTRYVGQVFVVGDYLNRGDLESMLLFDPDSLAPYPYEPQRLFVQHRSSLPLQLPDSFFDAVVICGSIDGQNSGDAWAHLVYEAGRMLKLEGVCALTVKYLLAGPSGGTARHSEYPVFDRSRLERFIVEASGLELADPVDYGLSPSTVSAPRIPSGGVRDYQPLLMSQVVNVIEGDVLVPLHVSLRKGRPYPRVPNAWAAPSVSTGTLPKHDDLALYALWQSRGSASLGPVAVPGLSKSLQAVLSRKDRPSPHILGLMLLRRIFPESLLVRLRWYYEGLLRRLPGALAERVNRLASVLGLRERG